MKIWLSSFSRFHSSRDGYINDIEKAGECDNDCGDDCSDAQAHFSYGYVNNSAKVDEYSDCGDDCGGPSDHDVQAYLPLYQESISYLATHHLQLASMLHIQACDASHWLICNPTEAGKIAVIDEEALSLLRDFGTPTTLQAIASMKNTSIVCLLRTILIFIDFGFLYDLDREPMGHSEKSGVSTLSAWLHITNSCNLRCHYCYVSKSSDHMEKETSRRAVDAILRSAVCNRYTHVHLKYAGGEAALQLPQIIAIHDYAQQQAQELNLRLSASILSNGTIMTQRMIEQLKERSIGIGISLDGIGAAHDQQRPYINGLAGSFSMVDRTISRLLANDLRPSINVTVSQRYSLTF